MKSASNTLKIISQEFKKIIWNLGFRAFLIILILIFVDFIIGGFVYYQYVLTAEKAEPVLTKSIYKFNDKIYQEVLKQIQEKNSD